MARKYIVRQIKFFYLPFFFFFFVTGIDIEFGSNFVLAMVLTKQGRALASSLFLFDKDIPFIVCAFCEQNFLVCIYPFSDYNVSGLGIPHFLFFLQVLNFQPVK